MSKLYYRKYNLKHGLDKYVKYLWVMRSEEEQSERDLLIPDGYPEIIFVQSGGYKKELLSDKHEAVIIGESCVIGIQAQSVIASRVNQCYLIGLKLNPVGAYTLLGNRLKSIMDTNSPLDDFGVDWLIDLNEKLRGCNEDIAIIDLVYEALQDREKVLDRNLRTELASSYLESILSEKGQITIQDLATKHSISVRQFQRNFKEFFGVSPKKFINIIRFKELYKSSVLKEKLPADFLDYGYFDQMHFIKDFQKHLGVNPSKSSNPIFRQMNKMAQSNS